MLQLHGTVTQKRGSRPQKAGLLRSSRISSHITNGYCIIWSSHRIILRVLLRYSQFLCSIFGLQATDTATSPASSAFTAATNPAPEYIKSDSSEGGKMATDTLAIDTQHEDMIHDSQVRPVPAFPARKPPPKPLLFCLLLRLRLVLVNARLTSAYTALCALLFCSSTTTRSGSRPAPATAQCASST